VHQLTGPRIENTNYFLDLPQIRCQTVQLNSTDYTQKSFDISSSSQALTVAFQDGRLDNTQFSSSKFKIEASRELALTRLMID